MVLLPMMAAFFTFEIEIRGLQGRPCGAGSALAVSAIVPQRSFVSAARVRIEILWIARGVESHAFVDEQRDAFAEFERAAEKSVGNKLRGERRNL